MKQQNKLLLGLVIALFVGYFLIGYVAVNSGKSLVYAPGQTYDRSFFEGKKYACGKTETFREAAIYRQSEGRAKVTRAKDGCIDKIVGGVTRDAYTGEWVDATSKLELDHVVPLAYAWKAGAKDWNKQKAYDFAHNMKCYGPDMLSQCAMVATSKSLNAAKGAKGPLKWLPDYQPQVYKDTFYKIMEDWELSR